MRHVHNNLSDRAIKAATCPKGKQSADYRDGGGLILRVTRTSRKTWRYEYRVGKKKKSLPLGSYPDISLVEARKQAAEARLQRDTGIDPVNSRKLKKQEAALELKQQSEKIKAENSEPTILDLINEYLDTLEGRPSQKEVKYSLMKDIPESWLERHAKGITLRECILVLDSVKKRGSFLNCVGSA